MASTPSQNSNLINWGKGIYNVYLFKNNMPFKNIYEIINLFYNASWETLLNGSQIENILSAHLLPMNVPAKSDPENPTASPTVFACGSNIFTGNGAPRPANHFIKFYYGSIVKDPIYNNYLDYSPYTSATIFLPFIGTKSIDIGSWWSKGKKQIGIYYQVNVVTGDCVCFLCYFDTESTSAMPSGEHILYSYSGNMAFNLPMSGADYSRRVSSAFGLLASASTTVAGIVTENPAMAVGGAIGTAQNIGGLIAQPQVDVNGQITGSASYCDTDYAYLTVSYPDWDSSAHPSNIIGNPCHKKATLKNLTGYTKVGDVHLTGIHATSRQLTEIEYLLKKGVVIRS